MYDHAIDLTHIHVRTLSLYPIETIKNLIEFYTTVERCKASFEKRMTTQMEGIRDARDRLELRMDHIDAAIHRFEINRDGVHVNQQEQRQRLQAERDTIEAELETLQQAEDHMEALGTLDRSMGNVFESLTPSEIEYTSHIMTLLGSSMSE